MFPTLNYLINYLFGTNITFNFPPTFGFMVALAFLSAAWVLSNELKRKEKLGLVKAIQKKVIVGKPASFVELVLNGLMGFIIGFKILGAITEPELFKPNPQGYLLSGHGNWLGGIVLGGLFAYLKYREKEKTKLPTPREETITIRPYQLVGNITLVAALWGIIGAKIFHNLEYWDEFMADPVGGLISASGLTFYGGLIGGFMGVWWYVRKNKIPLIHVADSVAPGLILAYGVGRIGCLLAGDGDWGIINSAYRIDDNRNYTVVPAEQIQTDLTAVSITGMPVYAYYGDSPEAVDYAYFKKPAALSFLPDALFAFDFPHNVNEEGVPITGCQGQYCNKLPLPVFPTPIYETLMTFIIFGVLMALRSKLKVAGQIFFLYLVLNGVERFMIEQIRVNSTYHVFGMDITQAEIIATVLIIVGMAGVFSVKKWESKLLNM